MDVGNHAAKLQDKMKWDVSPLKVKKDPAFIPTPDGRWSTNDGSYKDPFRSRLYSSPYVTHECAGGPGEEVLTKEPVVPRLVLDDDEGVRSEELLLSTDSGFVAQRTHFYDNLSLSNSKSDVAAQSTARSLQQDSGVHVGRVQSDADSGVAYGECDFRWLRDEGKENFPKNYVNLSQAKHSFNPAAPPFKPRSFTTANNLNEMIATLKEVTVAERNVKAIDVANFVCDTYKAAKRANLKSSVHDANLRDVHTVPNNSGNAGCARLPLTSMENTMLGANGHMGGGAVVSSSALAQRQTISFDPPKAYPILTPKSAKRPGSHSTASGVCAPQARSIIPKELGTLNIRPFNPAPGSPVPSRNHLDIPVSYPPYKCQSAGSPYEMTVPPVSNSSSKRLPADPGIFSEKNCDFRLSPAEKGSLSILPTNRRPEGADEGPKAKVTFADIVKAGINAIHRHKTENPMMYEEFKSAGYPIHTSIPPVIQASSTMQQLDAQSDFKKNVVEKNELPYRPSKYRTEPCTTYHTIGVCPYGERCNFYHSLSDKNEPLFDSKTFRYKTRLCKTWQKAGECPYGAKCDFAHGTDDLTSNAPYKPRYKTRMCKVLQQTGRCPYGAQCTFAHKQCELRADLSLIYKYKTEICNAWALGVECKHGTDCHFAHGESELQKESSSL